MGKLRRLTNEEISFFCDQLAMLLPAGITPYSAIELMLEDNELEWANELCNALLEQLRDGENFSKCVKATGAFPDYVVEMLTLGEEAGSLDVVVTKLAEYYKEQVEISDAIKNAVAYPLIMVALMILIFGVLLVKILPIFNQVFEQLGSGLSGVARQLMLIGNGIRSISGVLMALIAICVACGLYFAFHPIGKKKFAHILHTSRLTKNIFLYLGYSQFAGAMSMVSAAGLDVFRGIALATNLVDNELLAPKFAKCKEGLDNGEYLYEAIKNADIFGATQLRMLQIAHHSGNTEKVFSDIATYYDDKSLKTINRILGGIEPTLVIVFSFIVGLVLMSVIMPLISIMSSLG